MKLVFPVCLLLTFYGMGQAPPDTEIYLMDIFISKKKIIISDPVNITRHPGYDNQPFFHSQQPVLYYSSAQSGDRTDVMGYNFTTGKSYRITETAEREYSPTLTPDGGHLSCIIQRDSGAQDLGKYPVEGGEASVLINDMIIGYHAWRNNTEVLLFVLGDTMSLYDFNLATRERKKLASSIGRSLHQIPGTTSMSFVQKHSEQWQIMKLDAHNKISEISSTLPGREDLTWTPDGRLVMSDGKALFWKKPGDAQWTPVVVSSGQLPPGITRLAIHSSGRKMAVVVTE
jgi:Tol biopolymer transport system component